MKNILISNSIPEKELEKYICYLFYIRKYGLTPEIAEEIMKQIIPVDEDGKNLINFKIYEEDKEIETEFDIDKGISISLKEIENIIEILYQGIHNIDKKIFSSYMYLMVLLHESQHSYQYLFGTGVINFPNDIIKESYRKIFESTTINIKQDKLIKTIKKTIGCIIYNKKRDFLVMERNANIESLDFLQKIALAEENDKINNMLAASKRFYQRQGYLNDCKGALQKTFRCLLIYKDYIEIIKNNNINISIDERIRYGLEINEETRKYVLSLKK